MCLPVNVLSYLPLLYLHYALPILSHAEEGSAYLTGARPCFPLHTWTPHKTPQLVLVCERQGFSQHQKSSHSENAMDYYLKSPREDKTGKHLVLDLYRTILSGKQDQKRNIDSHLPTYFGEGSHQWSIVPTFEEETLEGSVAGWNRIMANNRTSITDMLLGNFRGKKSYPV